MIYVCFAIETAFRMDSMPKRTMINGEKRMNCSRPNQKKKDDKVCLLLKPAISCQVKNRPILFIDIFPSDFSTFIVYKFHRKKKKKRFFSGKRTRQTPINFENQTNENKCFIRSSMEFSNFLVYRMAKTLYSTISEKKNKKMWKENFENARFCNQITTSNWEAARSEWKSCSRDFVRTLKATEHNWNWLKQKKNFSLPNSEREF